MNTSVTVVGVDIGGTKMQLSIFDGALRTVRSWRVPTPRHDYETFLGTLADMVKKADEICGGPRPVGLALPGVVSEANTAISVHVPCINGQTLVSDIERSLRRPVAHENDVRAFTFSETRGGALDGARVAMGVVLGTGVAGTLAIDGQLHTTDRNMAGEYGHLPMPLNLFRRHRLPAEKCLCGAAGCAEQVLSGPGLLRLASHQGVECASVEQLLEDVRAGVVGACRILETYVDCLGYLISRLTLLLDPDVIVLGGGLSNISELYKQLPRAAEAYLFDGVRVPSILPPKFGATSGIRGAAILALEGEHCHD